MESKKMTISDILGEVVSGSTLATKDHQVSLEKLNKPLMPGAAMFMFCKGCGSYHQIPKEKVEALEDFLGKELPSSKYYYQTLSCLLCDAPEEGAELKLLSEIQS